MQKNDPREPAEMTVTKLNCPKNNTLRETLKFTYKKSEKTRER